MNDVEILNRNGILQIKMPTCLGDQPAFRRRLSIIRDTFIGKLYEEENYIGSKLWITFTLEKE